MIDVGYLSTEQRNNAMAAALAYVQPSLMESYSRTSMESWLAGRPVLVRAGSAVVEWHCSRSGGGRVFSSSDELGELLAAFLSDPAGAREMGERGRSYVMNNYQWQQVLDRIEADLGVAQPAPGLVSLVAQPGMAEPSADCPAHRSHTASGLVAQRRDRMARLPTAHGSKRVTPDRTPPSGPFSNLSRRDSHDHAGRAVAHHCQGAVPLGHNPHPGLVFTA